MPEEPLILCISFLSAKREGGRKETVLVGKRHFPISFGCPSLFPHNEQKEEE
jgi:hypothetical protein